VILLPRNKKKYGYKPQACVIKHLLRGVDNGHKEIDNSLIHIGHCRIAFTISYYSKNLKKKTADPEH